MPALRDTGIAPTIGDADTDASFRQSQSPMRPPATMTAI
jgi:hypothetical protein